MLPIAASLTAIAGVFGIGLIIGIAVLVTAEQALTAVAKTAARNISASFWAGVVTQLLAVPALVLLVLACAITIVGILAIPVAVLAWAMGLAGMVTLGTLATLMVIGRALAGGGKASPRSAAIRGLTVGLIALSLVWIGAALASQIPVAGVLARLVVVAFTWAIATVGMGAVVRSRIGISRISVQFGKFDRWGGSHFSNRWGSTFQPITDEIPASVSWDTPTPIQGVVAAKRPLDSTSTKDSLQ